MAYSAFPTGSRRWCRPQWTCLDGSYCQSPGFNFKFAQLFKDNTINESCTYIWYLIVDLYIPLCAIPAVLIKVTDGRVWDKTKRHLKEWGRRFCPLPSLFFLASSHLRVQNPRWWFTESSTRPLKCLFWYFILFISRVAFVPTSLRLMAVSCVFTQPLIFCLLDLTLE